MVDWKRDCLLAIQQRDEARAELAAERERVKAAYEELAATRSIRDKYERERLSLRAALELIADTDPDEGTAWFHSVANAALNKGGLMSDAEMNLVAWMRAHGMHDSAGLVERLAAERDALRAQWREDVFRAFQEGFNSSLSYVGEDGVAEAWGMSDAKARIDAALKDKKP